MVISLYKAELNDIARMRYAFLMQPLESIFGRQIIICVNKADIPSPSILSAKNARRQGASVFFSEIADSL